MFVQKIECANAPKAAGPYSQAVKLADFVYLSGMLPLDPTTGEVVSDDISKQVTQVMENIQNLLADMGLKFSHVVKTTIFITDFNDYSVVNDIYASYLAEPYPARSCVQVSALPKGVKVEIECTVIDTLIYEEQMQSGCGVSGCSDCSGCSGCH